MKNIKGFFTITLLDAERNVIWQAKDLPNITHNQGERLILGMMVRPGTYTTSNIGPGNMVLGLDSRSALAEGDTLSSVSQTYELAASNNYARITLSANNSGFPTFSTDDSTDWAAWAATATWSAVGGDWTSALNVFLANSTYLIGSRALPSQVELPDGSFLTVNYVLKIKEPA